MGSASSGHAIRSIGVDVVKGSTTFRSMNFAHPWLGSGGSEPFDSAAVEEISAGNLVVAREVLVRFHHYNSEDAQRLRGAVSSGDFDRVCEAAHRIRGSSRTVGASDLAIACERMEAAAGKGDWDAVAQAMEDFDREVGRMDRHISGLAAA